MEKEYIFGYLPSEADKMTLDEIYTYLIDKGVIDNTVSKNDLAIILEGVIKSITPDMIRGNVTIAGVTGNVATKVEEIYVDKFDEVEIPEKEISQDPEYTFNYDNCTYKYVSTNGRDAYGSYKGSAYPGIYYKNLETNEYKHIYNDGYYYSYATVLDNGAVLLSSDSYKCTGILWCYNGVCKKIYTSGYRYSYLNGDDTAYAYASSGNSYVMFIDASVGTVSSTGLSKNGFTRFKYDDTTIFASSNNSSLYILNREKKTSIYSSGYNWTNFYKASSGDLYISSKGNTNSGILKYTPSTGVTQIYNLGSYWNTFYEAYDGTIYVSSTETYGLGVLKISDNVVDKIYDEQCGWECFFEYNNYLYIWSHSMERNVLAYDTDTGVVTTLVDSWIGYTTMYADDSGTLLLSSLSNNTPGLLKINGYTAEQIIDKGYGYNNIQPDNTGGYYISALSSSASGVYYLKDTTISQIITSGYAWTNSITLRSGDTYIWSMYSGVFYANGEESFLIYTGTGDWIYLFEVSDDEAYISAYNKSSSYTNRGLIYLNRQNSIRLLSTGVFSKIFIDSLGYVYVSYSSKLYVIDKGTLVNTFSISTINYFYETIDDYIVCSTNTSGNYIWAIKNGVIYNIVSNNLQRILKSDTYIYVLTNYESTPSALILCKNRITEEISLLSIPAPVSPKHCTWYHKNLYISYTGTEAIQGLYIVLNGSIVQIHDTGYSWLSFISDSHGNIYFSSTHSSYTGLFKINDDYTISSAYTLGYSYKYTFNIDENRTLVLSDAYEGIYCLTNNTMTKIYKAGKEHNKFFQASNKDIYVLGESERVAGSSSYPYYAPIRINPETLSTKAMIYNPEERPISGYNSMFEVENGVLYLSSYVNSIYSNTYDEGFYIIQSDACTYVSGVCDNLSTHIVYNGHNYLGSYNSRYDSGVRTHGLMYVCGEYYKLLCKGHTWSTKTFEGYDLICSSNSSYIIDKDVITMWIPYAIPDNPLYFKDSKGAYYFYIESSSSTGKRIYYVNFETKKANLLFQKAPSDFYYIEEYKPGEYIFLTDSDSIVTGTGIYIVKDGTIYVLNN